MILSSYRGCKVISTQAGRQIKDEFSKVPFSYNKTGKKDIRPQNGHGCFGGFFRGKCSVFFYYNSARGITNRDAFTTHKNIPNHKVYYGSEGFGISQTDEYGFYNDGSVTFDSANIVCIGSSQTEAIQVSEKDKYVYLLNRMNETSYEKSSIN